MDVAGRLDLDKRNGMLGVSVDGANNVKGCKVDGFRIHCSFVLRRYFVLLGREKIPEKGIDRPIPLALIRGCPVEQGEAPRNINGKGHEKLIDRG